MERKPYIVASEYSMVELEKEVERFYNRWYVVTGGIAIETTGQCRYLQAMVLKDAEQ